MLSLMMTDSLAESDEITVISRNGPLLLLLVSSSSTWGEGDREIIELGDIIIRGEGSKGTLLFEDSSDWKTICAILSGNSEMY